MAEGEGSTEKQLQQNEEQPELLTAAPPLGGDLEGIFDDGDDNAATFADPDAPLDQPNPQQLQSFLSENGSVSDAFGDSFGHDESHENGNRQNNHNGNEGGDGGHAPTLERSSSQTQTQKMEEIPSNRSMVSNHQNVGAGEPSWQDDVADIPHRRELIRQIAQLLRDRKQNPTPKWLKELPYKARKLEEQLYKTAPSLKAYLDQSTLKHRLKKVAHAITSQFRLAQSGKRSNNGGTRGNSSTSTTSNNINRHSNSDQLSSSTNAMNSMPSFGAPIPSGAPSSAPGTDVSPLQQHVASQKLQEQILENIRQQQQIMRDLMQTPNQQQQQDPASMMAAAGMQPQAQAAMHMGGMGGMGNMGMGMTNPLLAQQAFMSGAVGMPRGATPQQMMMMNPLFANQLPGGALNAAAMMGMNPAAAMGSVIPAQPINPGMNAGMHPTMPPPNMSSLRNNFGNGAGNANGPEDNMSLSPNSFKW